jgi:predicted nucleotidyltransferase component of viral defense system
MLDDIQAREALHVLVLKKLKEETRREFFALKGGVNLRLFFGSVRYSEDMDLDTEAATSPKVLEALSKILKSPWLQAKLGALGLQGVEYAGRPVKNTNTTVRMKLKVLNSAGIALSTKIEMSLRGRAEGDTVVEEQADDDVVRAYIPPEEGTLVVPHYPLNPAIKQKINALAMRTAPEARDVFDLYGLARGQLSNIDAHYLRCWLPEEVLGLARQRAWELSYDSFLAQVVEFLSEDDRAKLGTQFQWETQQLFVVELVDAVLALPPAEKRSGGRA